jgi:hypothetical protein
MKLETLRASYSTEAYFASQERSLTGNTWSRSFVAMETIGYHKADFDQNAKADRRYINPQ